ncbi:HAD hydrolase family protein [Campylobacter gastrosuis]|uniref:HAD hydrolase family protein n=1 Tax=Campylobacter gastrosuis TaxID=2974576 RepID=A0ABT7HNW9_9BACT|nr:HAD hydrolase family protein [Campylobacter gastrosuis]MDL0088632.1 HAD hydrolase family protein [Campylobacter gastrosuis]
MKNLIIDLDGTITIDSDLEYSCKQINTQVVNQLKKYKEMGFKITIYTSRNMKTFNGNLGKINVETLPNILKWLDSNKVPYDEVIVGKPWCGTEGFYVDDRAIRPSEFATLSYDEIKNLLGINLQDSDNIARE